MTQQMQPLKLRREQERLQCCPEALIRLDKEDGNPSLDSLQKDIQPFYGCVSNE
jgi:hypothetical protein